MGVKHPDRTRSLNVFQKLLTTLLFGERCFQISITRVSYLNMQISWHGQYTVKITSKEEIVVLDPYSPETGLSPFRSKASVVALSNPSEVSMSHLSGVQGEPVIIQNPGEYSIRGLTLHALGWHDADNKERSLQVWGIEDMTLLHLGSLNRDLTDEELQHIERVGIDILLLPVGGGSGLSLKQALNVMTTIEPRIVIPIHYKLPHLKEELEAVDKFAKELGVDTAAVDKLTIKAGKLPEDDMQAVILKP